MEQVGDYRAIVLGCSVVKMSERIGEEVGRFAKDMILTEAQGGLKSNRRCLDQWLVLRGVCEVW